MQTKLPPNKQTLCPKKLEKYNSYVLGIFLMDLHN